MRIRSIISLCVLGIVAVVAGPAQSGSALDCGSTVTESVVLRHNIGPCSGAGLIVETGDVTIDMNGHTLSGSGNGSGVAIALNAPFGDVAVKNGTVKGFSVGVSVHIDKYACTTSSRPDAVSVDRVKARSNATGISVFGQPGCNTQVELTRNNVVDNTGDGIFAASFGPVHILENRIAGNGGTGILAAFDSVRQIEDNSVADNGGDGIRIDDSVTSVSNNVMHKNAGVGLWIHESVPSFIPLYLVSNNVAVGNAGGGMSASSFPDPPGPPAGDGNAAKHNGHYQCVLIVCGKKPGHDNEAWGSAAADLARH